MICGGIIDSSSVNSPYSGFIHAKYPMTLTSRNYRISKLEGLHGMKHSAVTEIIGLSIQPGFDNEGNPYHRCCGFEITDLVNGTSTAYRKLSVEESPWYPVDQEFDFDVWQRGELKSLNPLPDVHNPIAEDFKIYANNRAGKSG